MTRKYPPFLILLLLTLAAHCPPKPGYNPYYANVTNVSFRLDKLQHTPLGVQYIIPDNVDESEFVRILDEKTKQVERCLGKDLHLEWYAVIVPEDWYTSPCTQQQMIPSRANYRLCEKKKMPDGTSVRIPVECRSVSAPTEGCPCPCNFRSVVQVAWDGAPLPAVITAPNLLLYKAELVRLVTGVNNVWADSNLVKCARNN